MNNLIDFDIILFKLVNNVNFKKNMNKNDIFDYYKSHIGNCYSNLNILDKYRLKYKSLINHSWYSKYVLPNCTKSEMYLDFIKRFQYLLITDSVFDNINNINFIELLDLTTDRIKKFEQSSYSVLICYPNVILSYIFSKFYSSPLCHIFLSKYIHNFELNSNTITNIIEDCSNSINKMLFIKKNVKLYEIDENKPNLVIRCSEFNQLLLSVELMIEYFDNYNVLIDCWIVETIISDDLSKYNSIYINIVERLSYFHNIDYQYIVYIGNIDHYKSSFIWDRYNTKNTKLVIFLDNCASINIIDIPIINQVDILLIKHQSELELLTKYNFANKRNIYCIGNTTCGSLFNLTSHNFRLSTKSDVIIFYCDDQMVNHSLLKIIEKCCIRVGCNIKFLVNYNISNLDEYQYVQYASNETLVSSWNKYHVYVSFAYCTSKHIYNAIKQKQLIILPENNCFINKNNAYGSYIKYKLSKFNIDFINQIYEFEPDLESFTNSIRIVHNLCKSDNLTDSLAMNRMVENNCKLVEKHKIIKF